MRRGTSQPSGERRSEEVRKRRTQQSKQRISTVNNRVFNPVRPGRPVTARGNLFGTPIHQQSGTRARRQFYIAMDQAGAELRLPAIPLVNPGWRILSFAIVVLALVGIFSMWNSPFFQVQSVEVKGIQRLTPEEITAVLGLENLSIVEVNTKQAREAVIAAFPDLVDVRLDVQLPNIVTVSATERQPVIAVKNGDQVDWIDAEGYVFDSRGDAGPLLTILTSDALPFLPTEAEAAAAVAAATQAAGTAPALPAKPDDLLKLLTEKSAQKNELKKVDPTLLAAAEGLSQKLPPETQLVYSQANGLGWTDAAGCQIYIGTNLADFEERFLLYQAIANTLANQGVQPVLISVAYPNAPFYRLEH
jgi:hypothetical protein